MSSRIELEASYILGEREIEDNIKNSGFKFVDKITEEDTYFTDKAKTYIKDRICLRTRKTDDRLLELTYKPKTANDIEKYGKKEVNIELNVHDYEDIKYVLKELGFLEYVCFKKERKTYTRIKDNIEYNIMVDEIEDVGRYIELEILTDSVDKQKYLANKLDDFVIEMNCDKLEEKMKPYRDIVKDKQNELA